MPVDPREFEKAWGVEAAPDAVESKGVDVDSFLKVWGVTPKDRIDQDFEDVKGARPISAKAKNETLGDTATAVGAGLKRGVMDFYDTAGNALFSGINKLAKGRPGQEDVNRVTGNELLKSKFAQNDFENQYGDSLPALGGRIAGNVAITAPLVAAGSAPIAAGAARLGAAVAPGIADAITAARAGSGVGNKLISTGANVAGAAGTGAVQGAMGNALLSSQSDVPLASQIGEGATIGGAVGGAVPFVGMAARNLGSRAARLVEPFTEAGRNNIVDRTLAGFAGDGPTNALTHEIVPGSQPTLAQATGNAGLGAAEKNLRNVPGVTNMFAEREVTNKAARGQAYERLAGTEGDLAHAAAERDAQALPKLEQAFQGAKPADAAPVVSKIDEILASPSGKRDAVSSALKSVRDKIALKDGSLESDVAQLYGVRKAIADKLSPLAAGTGNDARLAAKELLDVQNVIDQRIEQAAPGFKGYLKDYSEMSKPLDRMALLQSAKITDSQGNITLAKLDSTIKSIEKARSSKGVHAAKSLSDDDLNGLRAIREDMRRESLPAAKAKPPGSDTVQNLATSNALGRFLGNTAVDTVGGGLLGAGYDLYHGNLPGTAAGVGALAGLGVKRALASKDAQVLDLLANRLVNPQVASTAFQGAPTRLIVRPRMNNTVPVTAANRLLAPAHNEPANGRY
jgi:hypothetical protein